MALDLATGSVPPLYREVFQILCPEEGEKIDRDFFVELFLGASGLNDQTLNLVWLASDSKQGCLSRGGFYKALALIALAQQGKSVDDKLLQTFDSQELPKPMLGDLQELKNQTRKLKRDRNPNVLGLRHDELCELDEIDVQSPEKKGLILKHIEYQVSSRRFRTTVFRRYNAFASLYELLLQRFPYRMIPVLPPKQKFPSTSWKKEFVENRRKALKRFLVIVCRHPVVANSEVVKYFLTFQGSDAHNKIKEYFKNIPDEFSTCDIAGRTKELVPADTQVQFGYSKEHIRLLTASVTKIKEILEHNMLRCMDYSSDMMQLGLELNKIGNDTTPLGVWATGKSTGWSVLQKGFKGLSLEFSSLGEKSLVQATQLDDMVVEQVNLFLDMLLAYKDLCERHEKGVLQDHQRVLQRMGQLKKKRMTATLKGISETDTVDQLESKILMQESEISNMENRNYFSLYCMQMETQLIHANLELLAYSIQALVSVEARGCRDLAIVWDHIMPMVAGIVESPGDRVSPSLSSGSVSPQLR